MKLLSSASKVVFILLAVALVALTFLKIVDAKDFITLAAMAFTFYFSNKGDQSGNLPYLGK